MFFLFTLKRVVGVREEMGTIVHIKEELLCQDKIYILFKDRGKVNKFTIYET